MWKKILKHLKGRASGIAFKEAKSNSEMGDRLVIPWLSLISGVWRPAVGMTTSQFIVEAAVAT